MLVLPHHGVCREHAHRFAIIAVRLVLCAVKEQTALLDLRGIQSAPANFFVICSGNVPSHTEAICDGVFETIKKATGMNPVRVEGYDNAEWILMDYFDVVVHIFLKDKRDHYRLEQLWADGVKVEYNPSPDGGK